MSNPQSPEPARWILEMLASDIPPWNRAFIQLERKPLNAYEDMLVRSFDRYLRRKGYLTKRQVEVLRSIATKHNVLLPPLPRHSHSSEIRQGASALLQETEPRESSNPLQPTEVIKPQMLAKWRGWGVPEETIRRAIEQRADARATRKAEERITIPNCAYRVPRLPKIEASPWGFAKVLDTEGSVIVRYRFVANKQRKIDRWLYRWEYYRPLIVVKTRTYELTEEIANLMHTAVGIVRAWDIRMQAYAIDYSARSYSARAVRICHLTEPHLAVPEKRRRAREILTLYKERPSIPLHTA